jgi:polar amino acid transport system substrate-binding protein
VYALAEELGYDRGRRRLGPHRASTRPSRPGPKDYDFNIQQFSVTEEREEIVDFSMVYYQPEKAVIALPDSVSRTRARSTICARPAGAPSIGTTDLDYLENILGIDDVAVFDDQAGVFQALEGGQIDATVAALPTALFATAVQVPDAAIVAVLPPDPNDNGPRPAVRGRQPARRLHRPGPRGADRRGRRRRPRREYLTGDGEIPEIPE